MQRDKDMPLDIDNMFQVIQEEGYAPTREGVYINFEISGVEFVAMKNTSPDFVYTMNICELSDDHDLCHLLFAANEVNRQALGIKAIVYEEAICFSTESYCKSVETYREFLHHSLSIITMSMDLFFKELHKLEEEESQYSQSIPS